jgi:hypothetical protein
MDCWREKHLDDNPSALQHHSSVSPTAGKIFFRYRFNPLNLIIFYRRSESLARAIREEAQHNRREE